MTSALALPLAAQASSSLRFCNANWLSSDLHAYSLSTFLHNEYPNALRGVALAPPSSQPELSSTLQALLALDNGDCDIVPECWEYDDRPCDGTFARGKAIDVGMRGENALYAPTWLLEDFSSDLSDFPAGYAGSAENLLSDRIPAELLIVGVPKGWAVRGVGECFTHEFVSGLDANKTYVDAEDGATQTASTAKFCKNYMPQHLLSRFVFATSGENHHAVVQGLMKLRKPFLFYGWRPDDLTEEENVVRLLTFGRGNLRLQVVYNNATVGSAVEDSLLAQALDTRWKLSPGNMTALFDFYRSRASVHLADGDVKRRSAMQLAADKLLCERETEQAQFQSGHSSTRQAPITLTAPSGSGPGSCQAVDKAAKSAFVFPPRVKDPTFPEKLVVWTKKFPVFVDSAISPGSISDFPACSENDAANYQPEGRQDLVGYTIDHLYEVFGLLGYARSDIILRCMEDSTEKLIDFAAQNKADVSVAAITVFRTRMGRVDFSTPYYSTGYKFLIAARPATLKALPTDFFMRPFTTAVWLCLLGFVVVVGALIGLVEGLAQRKRVEKLEEILTEDVTLLQNEEVCVRELRRFDAESAEVMIDNELLISKEEKRLLLKAVEKTRAENLQSAAGAAGTPAGVNLEQAGIILGLDQAYCVPVAPASGGATEKQKRTGDNKNKIDPNFSDRHDRREQQLQLPDVGDNDCSHEKLRPKPNDDRTPSDEGGAVPTTDGVRTPASTTPTEKMQRQNLHRVLQRIQRLKAAQQLLKSQYDVFSFVCGRDGALQDIKTSAGKTLSNIALIFGTVWISIYVAGLAAILTKRGTEQTGFSIDDLSATGGGGGGHQKRIAVKFPVGGTNVPKQFIESNFPSVNLLRATGYVDIREKVKAGGADAGVYDEPVLQWLAAQDRATRSCGESPLAVTGDLFGPQEYAYAFPKNSPLRDAVSEAVTYLRSRKHPDIDHELSAKWFPGSRAAAGGGGEVESSCVDDTNTSSDADSSYINQLTFHDFSQIFLVVSAAVGVVVALWGTQALAFACVNRRRR